MIIFIIFMIVFGLSGWVFALWVNDDWYKDSIKTINEWYNWCLEINEAWYNQANKLAKKLDTIEADKEET